MTSFRGICWNKFTFSKAKQQTLPFFENRFKISSGSFCIFRKKFQISSRKAQISYLSHFRTFFGFCLSFWVLQIWKRLIKVFFSWFSFSIFSLEKIEWRNFVLFENKKKTKRNFEKFSKTKFSKKFIFKINQSKTDIKTKPSKSPNS